MEDRERRRLPPTYAVFEAVLPFVDLSELRQTHRNEASTTDALTELVGLLQCCYHSWPPGPPETLPLEWCVKVLAKCLSVMGLACPETTELERRLHAVSHSPDGTPLFLLPSSTAHAPRRTLPLHSRCPSPLERRKTTFHHNLTRSNTVAVVDRRQHLPNAQNLPVRHWRGSLRGPTAGNGEKRVKKVNFQIPERDPKRPVFRLARKATGPKRKPVMRTRPKGVPEVKLQRRRYSFPGLTGTMIRQLETLATPASDPPTPEVDALPTTKPKPNKRFGFLRLWFGARRNGKGTTAAASRNREPPVTAESSKPQEPPHPATITPCASFPSVLEALEMRRRIPTIDIFFGEGAYAAMTLEKSAATGDVAKTKILKTPRILPEGETDSGLSIDDETNSTGPRSKQTTSISASEFLSQLSEKLDAKPTLQKINEKLKTLLAPNDQAHYANFYRLFEGRIPEGDGLIMSFPCTFQARMKELPVTGRLYLTLTMIGFNCSIFGYEKRFLVPLNGVTKLEKDRSSRLFPNSIKVVTANAEKYYFGYLKGRDRIYSLLFRVWRMNLEPDKRNTAMEECIEMNQFGATDPLAHVDFPLEESPSDSAVGLSVTMSDTSSESSADNNLFALSSTSSDSSGQGSSSATLPPVECGCQEHKGKLVLDMELPVNVHSCFQLLFNENEWMATFENSMKRSGKQVSPWSANEVQQRTRDCKYTVELDKTFGPKSAIVVETQVCNPIGDFNEGVIVTKEANNEGVPYADNFYIECTYCITRLADSRCRVKVHAGVFYRKYILGLFKTVIERSSISGLEAYYGALASKLKKDTKLLPHIANAIHGKGMPKAAETEPDVVEAAELVSPVATANGAPSANPNPSTTTAASPTSLLVSLDDSQFNVIVRMLRIVVVLLFLILITHLYVHFAGSPTPSPPASLHPNDSVATLKELRTSLNALNSHLERLRSDNVNKAEL